MSSLRMSHVPEHVAGVRLSYVHLFGFINESFSLAFSVVISNSRHLCYLHSPSTHHNFQNYPFRSCMCLFCYPWTRRYNQHRRVTSSVVFYERIIQPFRSEIAKYWMASIVLLCKVLCLVTCWMFPEERSPGQITANKCFAVLLAEHFNILRCRLRALHCSTMWCLQ
jgi:hypothetical protein